MAFWEKGKTEEQINAVSERVNKVENDVADIIKTNLHIDKQFNITNEQQKKLYEDNIEMKKALISLTNNQKKLEEQLKDVKINGEEIDTTRMSSAYILLLLSYLRVNMNRNPDKPLCCYRLYQKITEDIGLSERYISRIVEMLDVMNIVKFQEGKRIRYKKQDDTYGFLTTPKVFADYRHFAKDENGNQIIDSAYDYKTEIQKQLNILEESQKKM